MNNSHNSFETLRKQAIQMLTRPEYPLPDISTKDLAQLLQDFSMYKIELDMQNEELQRTQQELVNVRDAYVRLYNQSPVGYLSLDPSGIILEANQTFLIMVGIKYDELIGTPLSLLLQEEDRPVFLGRYRAFYANPVGKTLELGFRSSSTTPGFTSLLSAARELTPYNSAPGSDCSKLLLVVHDISERVLAQHALQRAFDLSEAANRSKNALLRNLSHELRTPLNGIMGMSQLLEYTELGDEQREYLQMLEESASNLLRLIDNLLNIAASEANKLSVELTEFKLTEKINQVTNFILKKAQQKGLQLEVSVCSTLPAEVLGDPVLLNQVLLHLLDNGLKFTDKGRISLLVDVTAKNEDEIWIRFRVTDSGIGIQAQDLKRIFQSFTQCDDSVTRCRDGLGLGLTICNHLVKLLRGTIVVESKPDVGSMFVVTLPFGVL